MNWLTYLGSHAYIWINQHYRRFYKRAEKYVPDHTLSPVTRGVILCVWSQGGYMIGSPNRITADETANILLTEQNWNS